MVEIDNTEPLPPAELGQQVPTKTVPAGRQTEAVDKPESVEDKIARDAEHAERIEDSFGQPSSTTR